MTATQGSGEWLLARAGHITASRVKDVMARLKSGKPAAAREDYALELATERLTGQALSHFVNAAMQWGTDQEVSARIEYEWITGRHVVETGFVRLLDLAFGCSPDGLVGDDGLVEFKCPYNSTVHIATVLSGAMPDEHRPQVQAQMAVTGRDWCDFCSFDPRMPDGLRLFVVRVPRDPDYIVGLLADVQTFAQEVADIEARLRAIQTQTRKAA